MTSLSSPPTVLVIDDEPKIVGVISAYLAHENLRSVSAHTAKDAWEIFNRETVALVLLDLMLPDFSGETLCKKIREISAVPIIMLTAKVDEDSVIRGLNIGADDYVTKPFSPRQLLARVKALLRRSEKNTAKNAAKITPPQILHYADLTLDLDARQVKRGEIAIDLTLAQLQILQLLMSRPQKIFTRDELLSHLNRDGENFDRSIDTHIKNLRKQIGDDPRAPKYITTVYGIGYRCGGKKENE